MKSIGLILTLLYLQASASFFDDFRGAISKVERGFGKLLSDVVTNVKDTIHCTISAVGHVLIQNGILDKTSAYKYKCKDVSKKNSPPVNIRDRRSSMDNFNLFKPTHHFDHHIPPRHISVELEKSIANVDKTINEILGYREVNRNLKAVSEKLKDETNHLVEISEILKREFEKISSNIKNNIKKINAQRRESSLDTSIWDGIQTLHDIQQHSKNSTEISEIRLILDKVVDKLNINSKVHKVSGSYDMDEIKNKLQKISNSNNTGKQIEILSAHSRSHDLAITKPEAAAAPKTFKDVAHNVYRQEQITQNDVTNTSKSLFSLDLDALDGYTPFSNSDHSNRKAVDDAKSIIADSQRTDKVLNDFFKVHRDAPDVFSNPDLFYFGKS